MIKTTVLSHSSASVRRHLLNHIKTKTNSVKQTLLKQACWQNKHCRGCRKTVINGHLNLEFVRDVINRIGHQRYEKRLEQHRSDPHVGVHAAQKNLKEHL